MTLGKILLVLGIAELVAPRRVVDFLMGLATEEGSDVELRQWVYTAARVEGAVILLWVLWRSVTKRAARLTDGS
ncbi:hypothetical protein [Halopelagius fulvigenes]|uniref:Uncharacterized protein n=1 Tax=Halopelagius fulvigenes TaxID=1198324 RepID=A0ABD5TU54_9EURY